jgi:hypothetical protein
VTPGQIACGLSAPGKTKGSLREGKQKAASKGSLTKGSLREGIYIHTYIYI